MAVPIDAPILMIMVLSSATPRVVVEVLSPTPEATDLRVLEAVRKGLWRGLRRQNQKRVIW
jgi:hypothetical protein